jgi:hypothetical protein
MRLQEFAYDLITTAQPTILPSDALVAIYFAHGIKWPAAVGYLRDTLTGQARPWTAYSSSRMQATTSLAVNGVAWGALASASAASASPAGSSRRGCTKTLVNLGPARTQYEVRRTPELHETIAHVMGTAATFVDGLAGSSAMPHDVAGVTNFLEELYLFYRRARGSRDGNRLATHGYNTKHFTRLFLMVFQRVDPGLCDMAPYKALAEFIPDGGKHIPAALAELSCAELANLFDVGVAELPMWACLADKAEELVSKLLVNNDVSRAVAWQCDREPLDCDGDEWPMTAPDTLEEWLEL